MKFKNVKYFSNLHADKPPVKGPVQKLVSSTRLPFKLILKNAFRQTSMWIVERIAFCKMFGLLEPVDPHPANVPGPLGMVFGDGSLTGRIRAVKVNGVTKRIC